MVALCRSVRSLAVGLFPLTTPKQCQVDGRKPRKARKRRLRGGGGGGGIDMLLKAAASLPLLTKTNGHLRDESKSTANSNLEHQP